jgi:hypothetical protein
MVLVELSTGMLPFEEKMDGRTAFVLIPELLKQGARPEVPASRAGPTIPELVPQSMQAIMQSAWAQDPSTRPTAKQCVEQLKQAAAAEAHSQSVPPPSAPPAPRTLNTVVSQADMITSTSFKSLQMISVNEVCCVKRSDGNYKYGRVTKKDAVGVVVLVDDIRIKEFAIAQMIDPEMLRKLSGTEAMPKSGGYCSCLYCTHTAIWI